MNLKWVDQKPVNGFVDLACGTSCAWIEADDVQKPQTPWAGVLYIQQKFLSPEQWSEKRKEVTFKTNSRLR